MDGSITFNSNDLQTYNPTTDRGIITNLINHTSMPDKVAQLYALADANSSAIPAINYPSKKITIAGTIKGADQIVEDAVIATAQEDLDNLIDIFKGYFNGKDKNLDIEYGTSTRRYIATANSISITRQQKAPFANFTIEFICTQPFGTDTTATSLINQLNYTSATKTFNVTVAGTAPYQLPIFTITLDALTGTGDYVQISNDNTGQSILVYGAGLTAGDVLVINCATRQVTVNGDLVDYGGTFLEIEPGAAAITYTDGFDTRQVDIVAQYYKRYQ